MRSSTRPLLTAALATLTLLGAAPRARAGGSVRILTWNVQTVGSPGTSQYRATLAVLKRIRADVVALQEVRSYEGSALAALARDAGYTVTVMGSGTRFGSLRNAIIARLTATRADSPDAATLSGDSGANDITRRPARATFTVPGGRPFTVVTEHWKSGFSDADELRRAVESARMAQALAGLSSGRDAFAVVGDYNDRSDAVPHRPSPFRSLPGGLPASFRLGRDLATRLAGAGIVNDPFAPLLEASGPAATILDARQLDGNRATRPRSGRRIDYILTSRLLAPAARAQVYDCRDEGLPGGLPMTGPVPRAGDCTAASDHLPVVADLTIPAPGGGGADVSVRGFTATASGGTVSYDFQVCATGGAVTTRVGFWLLRAGGAPTCATAGTADASGDLTIAAGACQRIRFDVAGMPAGTYDRAYVLADSGCALAEADEANNVASARYTVAAGANLEVRSLSVAPAAAGRVTLTTRLCSAAAATLPFRARIWLSRSTRPTCSSRSPDVDATGVTLTPGGCDDITLDLPAPGSGSRRAWLLLDADCVIPETDERDNTRYTNYTVP